jgi:hypothetical protein
MVPNQIQPGVLHVVESMTALIVASTISPPRMLTLILSPTLNCHPGGLGFLTSGLNVNRICRSSGSSNLLHASHHGDGSFHTHNQMRAFRRANHIRGIRNRGHAYRHSDHSSDRSNRRYDFLRICSCVPLPELDFLTGFAISYPKPSASFSNAPIRFKLASPLTLNLLRRLQTLPHSD